MILTKHEETKKGRLFHENEKLRIFVSSCSINNLYQVIILSSHKSVQSVANNESTLKSQYSLRTVAAATPLLNPALTGRGVLWAGWGL